MVIVDTLIARNRSSRIRLGVGTCTLSFAKGAVRDLTKLKVTGAGNLVEPHGWEIQEMALPKWSDGSYMNARVFVTNAYSGLGSNRYDVHRIDGGEPPVIHDLACVDAGAGEDTASLLLGDPPIVIHDLACLDAGAGMDAADLVSSVPGLVHDLECLDQGAGADSARVVKVTPGTKKRFEGEIRFEGGNLGETRQIRFTGTIDADPRHEGKIGTHWPPDSIGVPAAASSDGAPTAGRYLLTRRRERNEWEDGGVIHRTYWELQDTQLPDFHQGWVTVGFSDPRTTALVYTTAAIELYPRAFGCELGIWWTDFNGAERIESSPGVLEKWILGQEGTTFVEGQSFGMRYGATNRPVSEIPEGLERESALAQCEGPIWMMSEQWRTAGNFSWNGIVPDLPAVWEADHDAARTFIANHIAARPRPNIPNPFWGGLADEPINAGEWVNPYYGPVRRNRAAADQGDFAVTMMTWPAARLNEPLFLEAIWPDMIQEACCRVAAHRREAPNFKQRGPAAPYRWEDHPDSHWYENGPHSLYSPDMLGKLASIRGNNTVEGGGTIPIGEVYTHGHGWHMLFQSHYSANYLTGAYLMTGDPQLGEAIDDLCEQYLSSNKVDNRLNFNITWGIDQARALGRELLMVSQLIRCTNNELVRARMRARILVMFPSTRVQGPLPIRPTKLEKSGISPTVPTTWFPWQEQWVATGLYAALLTIGDVNNPNDPIRLLMNQVGEMVIMYGTENTYRSPPAWFIAGGVDYNNGQAVSPNPTQWYHSSGYELWSVGFFRLMQFLGVDSPYNTGAAIRARAANLANAVSPSDGEDDGFGVTGGFGRYGGWRAVLPG